MTNPIHVHFNHGLGDSANFVLICELHRRHGRCVAVSSDETNKDWLWKATGLKSAIACNSIDHPWLHPGSFWGDAAAPEHEAHKVATNINSILPPLDETIDELWRQLCDIQIDVMASVRPEIHTQAQQFLDGLTWPIVAFHAVGTNSQDGKKIAVDTQMELQRQLVEAGCSVVILDFDARAAQIGHERIRGIKSSWGHLTLEQLAALLSRCALLIGVDSGPLHFARLTPVHVLGVFFNRGSLLPHRIAVPSPRLFSLVPGALHHIWEDRLRQNVGWQFIDYEADSPTPQEITQAAMSIVRGTPLELSLADLRSVAGLYNYQRLNHDQRDLELRPDGTIGTGAKDCERRWSLRRVKGRNELTIHGQDGPTCTLYPDTLGHFHGRWNKHERMAITLESKTPTKRPKALDTDALAALLVDTKWEYRRIGYEDPREFEFMPDGRIGTGNGAGERVWRVQRSGDGEACVVIHGDGGNVKIRAFMESDGSLRGRWEENERMAIEITPLTVEIRNGRAKSILRQLTSVTYDAQYYEEHRRAGLDYLAFGTWQQQYGKWLCQGIGWHGQSVLDIGCACGSIVRGMGEAGIIVQGIDISEHMVNLGRDRWPDIAALLHVGDAVDLTRFADAQFDGIHSAQVAEHWIPDAVPQVLRELARITKVDGVFFCAFDTQELFDRQGRRYETDDPTHICIRPMSWWHAQLIASGWEVCTNEFSQRLLEQNSKFIQNHDWDWFTARKRNGV